MFFRSREPAWRQDACQWRQMTSWLKTFIRCDCQVLVEKYKWFRTICYSVVHSVNLSGTDMVYGRKESNKKIHFTPKCKHLYHIIVICHKTFPHDYQDYSLWQSKEGICCLYAKVRWNHMLIKYNDHLTPWTPKTCFNRGSCGDKIWTCWWVMRDTFVRSGLLNVYVKCRSESTRALVKKLWILISF